MAPIDTLPLNSSEPSRSAHECVLGGELHVTRAMRTRRPQRSIRAALLRTAVGRPSTRTVRPGRRRRGRMPARSRRLPMAASRKASYAVERCTHTSNSLKSRAATSAWPRARWTHALREAARCWRSSFLASSRATRATRPFKRLSSLRSDLNLLGDLDSVVYFDS